LGQYNSGDVATERDGFFDDPNYVAGLPEGHFANHNENVFAFSLSLASQQVQHFLAFTLSLPGGLLRRPQLYHFVQDGTEYVDHSCQPNCLFPSYIAYGDHASIAVTGNHQAAIDARIKRAQYQRSPRYWIARITGR
jgi:hypothetical protein